MHYTFDSTCNGWDAAYSELLARELQRVVQDVTNHPADKPTEGAMPFIETERDAIHIRNMAHLPTETKKLLISEADRAFARVMGLRVK